MASSYVHIILPVSPGFIPTYRTEGEVHRGQRVRVEFARREYIGVIDRTGVTPDINPMRIQAVKCVDTGLPDISEKELEFWHFISDYYLCPISDVYRAACPLLKTRSEQTAASVRERKRLAEAKMTESLQSRLQNLEFRLKKKQEDINTHKDGTAVARRLAEEIKRLSEGIENTRTALNLHLSRNTAADISQTGVKILPGATVNEKPQVLLSSSRTKRYIEEVKTALSSGRDALVLIPEIAVGDTLQQDFQKEFGSGLYIHNSSCTPKSRRETAEALRDSKSPEIILGTRISLFLPFRDLGLVIIDEEQDPSYKQTEPAPRINARDAAVVLGHIHRSKVILGSNCPSLETVYNFQCRKYLLTDTCSSDSNQCTVSVIDMTSEKRKNGVSGHFSYKLIDAIRRCEGPVRLIRAWEDKNELASESATLFPDRRVEILTIQESYGVNSPVTLTAVLQADALFRKNDFRADEKALQDLKRLQGKTTSMYVQTSKSSHPVFRIMKGSADTGALLDERRAFRLPPYSRLVDIIIRDGSDSRLSYMSRELSLKLSGLDIELLCIPSSDGAITLRVTLPKSGNSERQKIQAAIKDFEKEKNYPGHIVIDADPQ